MRYEQKLRQLKQTDPTLGALIEQHGACTLVPDASDPFASLCQSILHQQLSGKAAATITARFQALYRGAFPNPEALLATDDGGLRGVGISGNKVMALRDLAHKAREGQLNFAALGQQDDEGVIQRLIRVRGIGRWTAEMFLIFTLGRLDVFPVADLGIQKAIQRVYGYQQLPAERTMHRHGNKWKPYRTLATWYLWKHMDG